MKTTPLEKLAKTMDDLLISYQYLKQENARIFDHNQKLMIEHTHLIEKNRHAKMKVEHIINDLKQREKAHESTKICNDDTNIK